MFIQFTKTLQRISGQETTFPKPKIEITQSNDQIFYVKIWNKRKMLSTKHCGTSGKTRKLEEKQHQCYFCEKSFIVKGKLVAHERIHTGEKRKQLFQCGLCEFTTNQNYLLKLHELIHTNHRPFQCSFWEKTFRRKTSPCSTYTDPYWRKAIQMPVLSFQKQR